MGRSANFEEMAFLFSGCFWAITDVPCSTDTNRLVFGNLGIGLTCFEVQSMDIDTLFVGDFTGSDSGHYSSLGDWVL